MLSRRSFCPRFEWKAQRSRQSIICTRNIKVGRCGEGHCEAAREALVWPRHGTANPLKGCTKSRVAISRDYASLGPTGGYIDRSSMATT